MSKVLPDWCKAAKIAMIEQNLSINELADRLNMSRTYLSSVINGRQYTENAVSRISDELNISNQGYLSVSK